MANNNHKIYRVTINKNTIEIQRTPKDIISIFKLDERTRKWAIRIQHRIDLTEGKLYVI